MKTTQKLKTILIVDDDREILRGCKLNLEDKGYVVKTAMTLWEAKKYSEEKFDLAIIDGLEGKCFEICDIINAKRKVILTGEEAYIKTAKEKGIEVYDRSKIKIGDIVK